ncbi:hypothetical protein OIU85_002963 [Salix viminalis]|uniref:VAL1-3 N-terminal zinc finger domain-containing protein n=1 Tax=Salix viminalis TaxID=40686 RepID=A0A9Q0PY45_SALVM|nr:hypothetical protein OIU85_002963 [Salix viminalis]
MLLIHHSIGVHISAYEDSLFCDTFHSEEPGWRECNICTKRLHCGCIASKFFCLNSWIMGVLGVVAVQGALAFIQYNVMRFPMGLAH